ncbi:MAG: hypothetical protein ACLFRG_04305 [Desulfococcaceae bacterium]
MVFSPCRFLAVLLLTNFLFASPLFAIPYHPAGPVHFVTEFSTQGKTATPQEWRVFPVRGASGEFVLRFRHGTAPADAPPFCEVTFVEKDGETSIEWTAVGGVKREGQNGLLVMPGFPVPSEVLPIRQEEPEKSYSVESAAEGRVFLQEYTVRWETVEVETAEGEGWLRVSAPDSLRMVRLEDADEQLVTRQLWAEDGTWWLYEETPFRRSWRISPE